MMKQFIEQDKNTYRIYISEDEYQEIKLSEVLDYLNNLTRQQELEVLKNNSMDRVPLEYEEIVISLNEPDENIYLRRVYDPEGKEIGPIDIDAALAWVPS